MRETDASPTFIFSISLSRVYLSTSSNWLQNKTQRLKQAMAGFMYSAVGTAEEVQVTMRRSPSTENGLAALAKEVVSAQQSQFLMGPHSAQRPLGALPLEMLFQQQEEGSQQIHNQAHQRQVPYREGQQQQRIPLVTEALLRQEIFGKRDFSAGYSSTRAASGSSRSYEASERGEGEEKADYTFSGNTSPLLSTSFRTKSAARPATSDEAIKTVRRLRSKTSFLDREYDDYSTIRGRNKGRTYTSDTYQIRRASTKGVPVQSPFPNLKIPGRHPSSVVDLEEAAERLSMADSMEDSIRKEYDDIKHNESRKSSMRRSSLMKITTDIPYGSEPQQLGETVFQSPTSFIDPSQSERTGYSPAGAVLVKGRSRADSKCSKTSAYGTRPEPMLEGMPLAQFTGVTSVSRQNSQYSVISSRNISRAHSIAELDQEMAAIRRPLAVRNPSKDELDMDLGQQPLCRAITSDSQVDFEQSQQLFEDFDGQHINETPPAEREVEILPQVRPELGKRKSTATLLSPTETKFERPKSYADPLTGQQMVFYPAPVPSMLQLPPKLSQRPNAQARAKRHTQVLASAPAARPEHGRNKSAVWLPDVGDEGLGDKRKSFMDVDLSAASASAPARPKDTRRNMTQAMLPEHLRANEYFEQMAPAQVVEIKEQSAVKTLDDILDASAHAPVSAFTDHAFAGHLGSEIYGSDHRKTRTKSQLFGSGSGLLDPEGKEKENKKPILGKRASSFFGLVNRSEDALGGDRKSTLGILGRGKSPVYDVVGEKSPTLQRDDAREHQSEDEDEEEEQREMDGRYAEDVYTGAPTTLLAELQLRKQQAKQRTQPTCLPNGFRTTLLEMDAVAQVESKTRKGKRVTLAWQDQAIVQQEREQESEDEEVPLGMLFPEQARRQKDNSVRPMGLMERRELEDNEPLSKRRERLLGKQPLMRPAVVKRASTMMNFPTNNSGETFTPAASVSQINFLGGSDTGALPGARPLSEELSQELIGRFGTPEPKIEAAAEVPEEEETLGQRRKRLIAEREARDKEVRSGTPDQDAGPRPVIKQRRSMADVLQAHPARTPSPGIQQHPGLHTRRSSQDLLKRPLSQNRLSSMNRLSANLAAPPPSHSRTNSTEFPHLAAIEKERKQKAQIAQMQAEVQAQQHQQHTTMRGLGLLGSQYAGSNLNYQAQQQINSGMGLGTTSQAEMNVPLMAGMVGPNGGVMMASPGVASTQSGYFGNKEMVDRMIAMRLASQAALNPALRPGQAPQVAGGFVAPAGQQMMGTGLGVSVGTGSYGLGSQGPMGGQRGMGKMGLGRGMGPQNQGEWRNQQAQWAHWARMQGLGMGLSGGGANGGVGGGGAGNGGVDMVEAWRRGVGATPM